MSFGHSELIRLLQFQLDLGVLSSCYDSLDFLPVSLSALVPPFDGVLPTPKALGVVPYSRILAGAAVNSAISAPVATFPSFSNNLVPSADVVSNSLSNVAVVRSEVEDISGLDELREYVLGFKHCSLRFGAKNTVFSDGNPLARIMLIGEAPGEQEDLQGIPFCGKSGILLDEVLSSIGLNRKDNIYISNSIFWRPPANRKPTDDEISVCRPILEKHISIINPNLIIVCGGTAMESVLQKTGITKLAGEFFDYTNQYMSSSIKAVPIFHPAFLLRNPISKSTVWKNMIDIRDYCLGLGLPL